MYLMFKVRCKLIAFKGDVETFPCHFKYKIGDEFYYDGDVFTGRICQGLFPSMIPVIKGTFLLGNKYNENVMHRYRGFDAEDASMAMYDGAGYRPWTSHPQEAPEKIAKLLSSVLKTEKAKGGHFVCGDTRILAEFSCEPVDLSDSDYCQPFYRREIAVLEKIEVEPGIKTTEILKRFSEFERDNIAPPLTPIYVEVILEALTDMSYIEIRGGKAYPLGRTPPSRPVIGKPSN
jgi:uncharacterized repeat protein (TIGR04076 family)